VGAGDPPALSAVGSCGEHAHPNVPESLWKTYAHPWKSTCRNSDPLVVVQEGFLPPTVFAALRSAVLSHPRLSSSDSDSLGASFDATFGFIARFNLEGAKDALPTHPVTACLLPFFQAVRDSRCNAFVLNVLGCRMEASGDSASSKESRRAPVVDWHRDATLGLTAAAHMAGVKPQLAHQVCVLYLSCPQALQGGRLLLRSPSREPARQLRRQRHVVDVDAAVSPAPNRLVRFRGDAEHAVEAFSQGGLAHRSETKAAQSGGGPTQQEIDLTTPKGSPTWRISLVLEQYRVPPGSYDYTVEFELVDPRDYRRDGHSE